MSGFYSQKYGWVDPFLGYRERIEQLRVYVQDDSIPEHSRQTALEEINRLERDMALHGKQ